MTWNLKSKVCIVGSGFCGYAAYKKLKENNVDLLLIEGGEIQTPTSENEQSYYKVSQNEYLAVNHKKNIKNGLDLSFWDRKFTLGGSSECWGGWIRPLEESTYTNSFLGLENQVWGDIRFDKQKSEVLNLLNSPTIDFSPESISKKINIEIPKLPPGLDFTTYAWAPSPLRLKDYWIKRLKISNEDNKDVIAGYKLIDFKIVKNKLSAFIFKNKDGNALVVESDYFIFCMGGVENAKFTKKLLRAKRNYLNKNINLGKFQEHPHLYFVAGFNKGENLLPKIMTEKFNVSSSVHDSFKDGKLNISIKAWDGIGTPKVTMMISENKNKFQNKIKKIIEPFLNQKKKSLYANMVYDYIITMRCEQTPNNSSLKFSSNKTSLVWKINDDDFVYYSDYLRRIASFLIVNKFAKNFSLGENAIKGQCIPSEVTGGSHHMGTVPYTLNNELINDKFRLTEHINTYVVGCSSFPVSGYENPTHAAMATSLIAADDIIKRLL